MAKIEVELPESFIKSLEARIETAVEKAIAHNTQKIFAQPQLLTRDEVVERLRISKPTLRRLEIDGKLIPQRAGRRVLFDARIVENFLHS